jgi:hypothetical protein
MPINRLNNLPSPSDSMQAAIGKRTLPDAATTPGERYVPPNTSAERGPTVGVVLQMRTESLSTENSISSDTAIYSNGAKRLAPDSQVDAEAMAQAHQLALDRNAGTVTQLWVGKDGVLEAKPRMSTETKPSDFVSFAVAAMRDFAEEAQRLERASTSSGSNPIKAAIAPFRSLQSLAAKLNILI